MEDDKSAGLGLPEWDWPLLRNTKKYVTSSLISTLESERTGKGTVIGRDDCEHDFELYQCSDYEHLVESACYICSKCSRRGCSLKCVKEQMKHVKAQVQKEPSQAAVGAGAMASPSTNLSSLANLSIDEVKAKDDKKKHNSKRSPKEKASTKPKTPRGGLFARPKHGSFQENATKFMLESSIPIPEPVTDVNPIAEGSGSSGSPVASVVARNTSAEEQHNDSRSSHNSSASSYTSARSHISSRRSSIEPKAVSVPKSFEEEEDNISDYLAMQMETTGDHRRINSNDRWPVGIPFKVKLLRVIPDTCVVFQSTEQREQIEKMMKELKRQNHTLAQPLKLNYVAVIHEAKYYRAQIEKVDSVLAKCRVRLVDTSLTLVKTFREIYELPMEFLRVPRQLGTLTLADVKPVRLELWKAFLEKFIDSTVTITRTHALSSLKSHHYGSIVLENGKQLSDLLIIERLAEKHDYVKIHLIESIVTTAPQFVNYEILRLRQNQTLPVLITHIESPSEFFVTDATMNKLGNSRRDKVDMLIKTLFNVGCRTRFSTHWDDGARMCLASHVTETGILCRAFCRTVDFTVSPPQATVYLIDYGIVGTTPLDCLSEYIPQLADFPPLAYRCRLAAQPTGDDWSNLVVTSLNSLMSRSNKERVNVTCIDPNGEINSVTLRERKASTHLLQCLEEVGHVIQDVRTNRFLDEPVSPQPNLKHLDPPAKLSFLSDMNSDSGFFYGKIPEAKPLSVLDKLKTRRLARYNTYVVTTERCYKLYLEFKVHCRSILKENYINGALKEQPSFNIGDVVLAPRNFPIYHRACITDFETYCGVKYANCYLFDVVKCLKVAVKDLMPADDYCMKMEKLSHIIWLDGTTESTILHSSGYHSIMAPRGDWTYVSNISMIGAEQDKYMLKLSVEEPSGHLGLLTEEFKHVEKWDWEKLYDLGFFTLDAIITQMHPDNSYRFSAKDFLMKGKAHLNEMRPEAFTVIVRRARFGDNKNKIHLSVTPIIETVKMDFQILLEQMLKYTSTVKNAPPSPSSTTYPHIVMLRKNVTENDSDSDAKKRAISRLKCLWHRSMYQDSTNSFECVDCFLSFPVSKDFDAKELYENHKLIIREICPEMLKIPPLGKRLVVDLPSSQVSSESLIPLVKSLVALGSRLDVVVKNNSTWMWNDEKQLVAEIPVTMPQLSERIYQRVLKHQAENP